MKKNILLLTAFFTLNVAQAHIVDNFQDTMDEMVLPESQQEEVYFNYNNNAFLQDDHINNLHDLALEDHREGVFFNDILYIEETHVKVSATKEELMNKLFANWNEPYFCYNFKDYVDSNEDGSALCQELTSQLLDKIFNQRGENYEAAMVYTAGNMYGDYESLSLYFPVEELDERGETKRYGQVLFDIVHEI